MRAIVSGMVVLGLAGLLAAAAAAPPAAPAQATEEGFASIFNGKDLTGWDGNPKFWSVKDGAIRGQTTKENPTKGNTFCIWRGGTVGDFELRLTYRLQGGNSGVQYRSKDLGNWVVGGYQAEIAGAAGRDGYIYEEKGKRGRMCTVGEKAVWGKDGKKEVTGSLKVGDDYLNKDDWNDYRILVVGNHIQHFINGVQTIDFTDEDPANQAMSGILALQIHAGQPMVVEFKNIRLKQLGGAAPATAKPATK